MLNKLEFLLPVWQKPVSDSENLSESTMILQRETDMPQGLMIKPSHSKLSLHLKPSMMARMTVSGVMERFSMWEKDVVTVALRDTVVETPEAACVSVV